MADTYCEPCEFDQCFEHDPTWAQREEISLILTPNDPVS